MMLKKEKNTEIHEENFYFSEVGQSNDFPEPNPLGIFILIFLHNQTK